MKFNIGLLGCGRISKNHFDAIKQVEKYELVGVCDTNEERAKKAGEEHGAPHFTDLNKMLREKKMSVLAVCTPSGLHSKHGIIAAENSLDTI